MKHYQNLLKAEGENDSFLSDFAKGHPGALTAAMFVILVVGGALGVAIALPLAAYVSQWFWLVSALPALGMTKVGIDYRRHEYRKVGKLGLQGIQWYDALEPSYADMLPYHTRDTILKLDYSERLESPDTGGTREAAMHTRKKGCSLASGFAKFKDDIRYCDKSAGCTMEKVSRPPNVLGSVKAVWQLQEKELKELPPEVMAELKVKAIEIRESSEREVQWRLEARKEVEERLMIEA